MNRAVSNRLGISVHWDRAQSRKNCRGHPPSALSLIITYLCCLKSGFTAGSDRTFRRLQSRGWTARSIRSLKVLKVRTQGSSAKNT